MAHSFRDSDHLPNLRSGGPADPQGLPRQRRGTTPQMHGRFPDYDVLANAKHWDEVTRDVVLKRAREVPPVRFFDALEEQVLRLFLDVVLAQDREPRIPVFEMVDAKMHAGQLDGYRYEDMPEDPETWRIVARGLRAEGFVEAGHEQRLRLVERFTQGDFEWEGVNVQRAWSVVMRGAMSAFYSHPWAWNEIGFGGPAYPRGYMRLQPGPAGREPYEAEEAFGLDPVEDVPARGLE
ncbi:MAG TPA: gluconate 2-dehydrogenase subunit 3 family protein [Solirubrobacteraceae bacterium]